MPECAEILMNMYTKYLPLFPQRVIKFDSPLAIQFNSRPNQSVDTPFPLLVEGLSYPNLPFFFHDSSLSLNPSERIYNIFILENKNSRYFESSKSQESFSCACFRWEKFWLYQQNRIRYFDSFVDQATPGFELGKKDLQSPALPLGHAAKMIQNRWQNFFFIVLIFWIPFFNPFPKS